MSKPLLPTTKPYFLRALHEWCCDHGFTPYITVAVDATTVVPKEYVKDDEITLNVSPDATGRLTIDNEAVQFSARFNGTARDIWVPMGRVAAIYARENGVGMGFDVDDTPKEHIDADGPSASAGNKMNSSAKPESKPKRPSHLQRVK